MIDLNYNRRFKEAVSIDDTDYIYYDNGTQVLKRISYADFKTNTFNGVLNGGINNIDEDVPQLIGGLNGISKNSNTINND